MTIDPLLSMALTTGFLGSGHCIGMCGGLITAFTISIAKQQRSLLFQILYNSGRIATYTLIGAVVGWLGSVLAYANLFHGFMRFALLGSDLFIIIVGLGTAGLFARLNIMKLEFSGPVKVMAGLAAKLRRLPLVVAALPLGLIMGFLPCGFSYAMAITAAQTTSSSQGALTMLFFGIGTAPALLLFGGTTQWLSTKARIWMLRTAGLMVALIGAYNLIKHLDMMGWSIYGPLQFLCH